MHDLTCMRCGKVVAFPLDLPLTGFICNECSKRGRGEEVKEWEAGKYE